MNNMGPAERAGWGTASTSEEVEFSPISLRVSPHSYLSGFLMGSFLTALLLYLSLDLIAIAVFFLSWVVLPFLALRDRVTFDGRRLERTGILPGFWARLNQSRRRLKITDIAQVETHALRAAKRGGDVYYRYRTVVRGRDISIAFASGGDGYRRMVRELFSRVESGVLDLRSTELRDHLTDPKETLMRAEFARIPSTEVLKEGITQRLAAQGPGAAGLPAAGPDDHAEDLHSLANELRLSGYLVRALEVFRRALRLGPRDARLLLDFARCLHSYAGLERSPRLGARALAGLRLCEMRAASDPSVLSRLGEAYLEMGDTGRAARAFARAAAALGDNFRSSRGLAEMALLEGKLAHVVHHFGAAQRTAGSPALKRWARGEADYFTNLSNDDEYLEMEIGRVSLLEKLERLQTFCLRLAYVALPIVLAGLLVDDQFVANVGWSVSSVALLVWAGLIVSVRMLAGRIPYDMMADDDDGV